MKNRKILFIAFTLILIMLFGAIALTGCSGGDTIEGGGEDSNESSGASTEKAAPDFTVTDKDGSEVKFSDMAGKPIVLNFWASWCGPCKSEMPDFNEAYAEYGDEVIFMMVNLTDGARETVDTASAYVEGQGFSFPVYYDTMGEGAEAYEIYSIPCTYFIDAEGNIEAKAHGAMSGEALREGIGMIVG